MRVALIGLGDAARNHVNFFHTCPDEILIDAVIDETTERLTYAEHHWGGTPYPSVEAMLNDGRRPDAAWLCVPPHQHGDIEKILIAEGIPFFVEIPLSADRYTAEEIGRLIEQKSLIVGVGYHWRAFDHLREAHRLLVTHPPRLVIGEWHDYAQDAVWWQRQETNCGQFVSQAAHLIDLARFLVGEGSVHSAIAGRPSRPTHPDHDVASVSAALIRFENQVIGTFSASSVLSTGESISLQILCDDLHITITPQGVKVKDENSEQFWRFGFPTFVEDRAFLRAIQEGDPAYLFSSYADALITHRLCHDIVALCS